MYGSILTAENSNEEGTRDRLRYAVEEVIRACDTNATILWEMSYISQSPSIENAPFSTSFTSDPSGRFLKFPLQPEDVAFDDSLLKSVRAVWERVMGPAADGVEFMRFEERSGEDIDEE